MNEEGRWQEADGRREQLDIVSKVHAMNLPHTVDYQNSAQTIHPSNASYLNRNNLGSERRFIKPSASCPLPSAFPPKEDTPLEFLCSSPETINPAIVTARYIQHLELSGQVTPEMMPELAKQAQAAIALRALAEPIAKGKQAITDYNHSLEKLKLASPQPNQLPWGF